MQIETLQKHKQDLSSLLEKLLEKSSKLDNLKNKLFVDFSGDELDGKFVLKFTHTPTIQNSIQDIIIKKFIDNYGLNLEKELEDVSSLISFIDTIMLPKDFCEVDLFDHTKEPVIC